MEIIFMPSLLQEDLAPLQEYFVANLSFHCTQYHFPLCSTLALGLHLPPLAGAATGSEAAGAATGVGAGATTGAGVVTLRIRIEKLGKYKINIEKCKIYISLTYFFISYYRMPRQFLTIAQKLTWTV